MSKMIEITGTKWSVKHDSYGNWQPHRLVMVKNKKTKLETEQLKALISYYPTLGKALSAIIEVELYETIPDTVGVNEWLTKYNEVFEKIAVGVINE